MDDPTGMTDDEKRHDQLTRAPKSDERDAAPRIETTEVRDGVTRIDIAETAVVRPGADPGTVRDGSGVSGVGDREAEK